MGINNDINSVAYNKYLPIDFYYVEFIQNKNQESARQVKRKYVEKYKSTAFFLKNPQKPISKLIDPDGI